jgi:tetratricopeptide (TPR) repeat protein
MVTKVDAFTWTVIGSVAGVVGAAAAVVFGFIPLARGRRRTLHSLVTQNRDDQSQVQPSKALLPAPILDVEVRGRQQVIEDLIAYALAASGQVQVLSGLGGSGKSTVARAVAARLAAEGHSVWWVPAADAVPMTQLLLGLAEELGASHHQVEEALAGRVNPSDLLWHKLQDAGSWMLVLDNADDPAALTVGGRLAGSGSGWLRPTDSGSILVTSRISDRHIWGPVAHVRRLEPLDESAGAQVLLDLAPQAGDRAAARNLSTQLGGLPLALHQAGSYLASPFASAVTIELYQQALSLRFSELMSHGTEDRTRVIATWELSLDALAALGIDQARTLLRVLSCFSSAIPVPPVFLKIDVLTELCGSVRGVEEGLSSLLSVGLIDTMPAMQAGMPSVKVHPLVAQTIRYQAGGSLPEFAGVAVELLEAAVRNAEKSPLQDAADGFAFILHLQAMQSLEARLPAAAEASLVWTAARLSLALIWGGSYVAAREVADSGLKRKHGLPEDHEELLGLRKQRASAWQFLGQYARAEEEYSRVLVDEARVLGADHLNTLATRHYLAATMAAQGKTAEALTELQRVLITRLEVLGADHPSTLGTRHEIARALAAQGKTTEALAEYRQVLIARQRVLGNDHPNTLATRHDIAQILGEQGEPAEALAETQQVLTAQMLTLGADHPDALTSRHNVARALAAQGKTAEALAEHRQVLITRQQVLGSDHPSTLTTRHEIAFLLAAHGKTAEALAEFQEVLTAQTRTLGADHPETLTSRHDVARMLAAQGRTAEALAEFQRVLTDRLRVLGVEHSFTLATHHEIAHVLSAQGNYREAENEYRKVLTVEVRVLGADHPSTLTTRTNLASMLANTHGRTAEALTELRQVLATQNRVLGTDHPDTLPTRVLIAATLAAQRKVIEALSEFEQVLATQIRVLGPEHPDTVTTMAAVSWLRSLRNRA